MSKSMRLHARVSCQRYNVTEHVHSTANQAKENALLQTHIHLLVSLNFPTQRATCKAIKTAADFKKASVTYGNACFILEIEK